MRKLKIDGRLIGKNYPPYIIAELSANHNGQLENALQIVEEAKKSGADAVKLQTYRPDTITLDCESEEFIIQGGIWNGRTLYELYEEAHMPWDWHKPLFDRARELGITIFSSPFDSTAVDLLEDLNAPAYKIASFEAVDLPLIKYAASTGKPIIISTGMASDVEITEAIAAARDVGCKEIAVLHCVSEYPAPASEYNLKKILQLEKHHNVVIGLSDHTIGNATAIASVAIGASIVEKHFTLERSAGGPDSSFSLEPSELKNLCEDCATAWGALEVRSTDIKLSEVPNKKLRRSLYTVKELHIGDTITAENIRSIRPGYGLSPKFFDDVIGKKVVRNVPRGTALSWDMIAYT